MKVLMVCSELAPLAKTGGLADAVAGLSGALAARGHDVRIVLPKYAHLPPPRTAVKAVPGVRKHGLLELEPAPRATAGTSGRRSRNRPPRIYLVELGALTGEGIYTGDARDAGRFLALAEAALELAAERDWRPDVIHCHDWHAALLPALQRARGTGAGVPVVLTLHNIGYQGIFDDGVLAQYGAADLRGALPRGARAGGAVNFLRAGILGADAVTTVSPTYAKEILTPEFGMGLEDALAARGDAVVGILNGVDYDTWGPTTDPYIDVRYDSGDITPKYRLKGTLEVDLGLLPDQNAPLIGVVTRLAAQKGVDLVTAALPALLASTRANLAFLGNGDADLARPLAEAAATHPRRVSFTDGYVEPLAHRILAGSDLALVPSRYEPCGLTQMYALRYGTIPVVRATGGLADTIRHFDPVTALGNGSVFRDADPQGLLWGIRTALGWFDEPAAWARLVENAMAEDFSWRRQVRPYEALYRELIESEPQ